MHFDAFEVSLQLIQALRSVVADVRAHDADLARQVRTAASSIALNVSEGRRRTGKDRTHLWRIAAGSAEEVRAALRVAQAWGHLPSEAARAPLDLVDRLLAMLYRMTNPRP